MSEPAGMMCGTVPVPFCKGCGHTHVVRALDRALASLGRSPHDVALVTDIGCIGLADGLFPRLHTVHTTHGRSTAFATGLALADGVLAGSKLKTIVMIGDGGAMIGLLHLVHAALLNVDVTVLLCNNFLFGMTGGQHSAFSPLGFVSPTTPGGNIVPPLDLCKVLADARAGFVARTVATDKNLAQVIASAVAHPGFALVEIVGLCTEHAAKRNELKGNSLARIVEESGQTLGSIARSEARKPFAALYRETFPPGRPRVGGPAAAANGVPRALTSPARFIVAGSAGERVQSAARALCEAAARCGLFSTQKNDNPVTQGSGFSIAEVVLAGGEILYTGIEVPTAVIAVSGDGMRELGERIRWDELPPSTDVILDEGIEPPATGARVIRRPFRSQFGAGRAALEAIRLAVGLSGILPESALGS